MKTTLDIADSLFKDAKRVAEEQKSTFKDVVESALRLFLKSRKRGTAKPFKLKRHSFKGQGLADGLSEGSWEKIRERAYEGRGG